MRLRFRSGSVACMEASSSEIRDHEGNRNISFGHRETSRRFPSLKPNLTVYYLCKRSKKPVSNVWIALISFTENADIHLEELF